MLGDQAGALLGARTPQVRRSRTELSGAVRRSAGHDRRTVRHRSRTPERRQARGRRKVRSARTPVAAARAVLTTAARETQSLGVDPARPSQERAPQGDRLHAAAMEGPDDLPRRPARGDPQQPDRARSPRDGDWWIIVRHFFKCQELRGSACRIRLDTGSVGADGCELLQVPRFWRGRGHRSATAHP